MAFYNDELALKDNKRFSQWAIALSLFVFVLITIDMKGDYNDGVPWQHLLTEILVLILSLAGVIYFGWLYYQFAQAKISFLKRRFSIGKPASPTMA